MRSNAENSHSAFSYRAFGAPLSIVPNENLLGANTSNYANKGMNFWPIKSFGKEDHVREPLIN
jgi:hypothetical protein